MLLVDGQVEGRAVHLAGRDDHAARRPVLPHRLEHVQCSQDVDGYRFFGVMVRVGNRDDRAQVKNHIDPGSSHADGFGIAQIGGANLHLLDDFGRQQSQVAPAVTRGVARHRPHQVAFANQQFDEVAADESACPGDQCFSWCHDLSLCV
jgi:hypothetical protein